MGRVVIDTRWRCIYEIGDQGVPTTERMVHGYKKRVCSKMSASSKAGVLGLLPAAMPNGQSASIGEAYPTLIGRNPSTGTTTSSIGAKKRGCEASERKGRPLPA